MDGSGGNRYELLYMDDDASDPLDNLVRKKAKQQKQKTADAKSVTAPGGQHGQQHQNNHSVGGGNLKNHQQNHNTTTTINSGTNKKLQNQNHHNDGGSGKENKSSAMNKNIDNKKVSGGVGGGQKPKTAALSNNTGGGKDLRREGKTEKNVNFKQNGEVRERNNRNRNERGDRSDRGDRDDRPIQNGLLPPSGSGDFANNEQQQRTQRGGNRGGNHGGNQRNRNFDGRGKREFDRQSGSDKTGVKAVDKRDGAGAHNWGSLKQDIEDLNKSNDESNTDKDESGEQQTEQTTQAEEETKELTLDEWKAQRAVRAKPQYNIRKAGEGEDLSQWKKMVALNKKKVNSQEKDEESEEELEYDPSMYPQRVGRLQRVLDIEFHFNDGRRGGNTGRGRGRGPRGAGGRRGPRNTDQSKSDGHDRRKGQNAPKVDDEHDFPSLG